MLPWLCKGSPSNLLQSQEACLKVHFTSQCFHRTRQVCSGGSFGEKGQIWFLGILMSKLVFNLWKSSKYWSTKVLQNDHLTCSPYVLCPLWFIVTPLSFLTPCVLELSHILGLQFLCCHLPSHVADTCWLLMTEWRDRVRRHTHLPTVTQKQGFRSRWFIWELIQRHQQGDGSQVRQWGKAHKKLFSVGYWSLSSQGNSGK